MGAVVGGDLAATAAVVGTVFALYLVRAWGVAAFATIMGLGGGLSAPGIFALRVASDLVIAAVLFAAVTYWTARRQGAEVGRIGGWLARLRDGVTRGSVFTNTLLAGYFLNAYLVFGLVPTLKTDRRRALAGALVGDLAGFALDLVAILGLSALFGGSRTTLSILMTVVALALAGLNYLIQRRLRPAPLAELAVAAR